MIKKWNTLSQNRKADFRIFNVDSVKRESQLSGKQGEFYLVNAPNWVTIVPELVDENGVKCFLMVKQYRHGSDSLTLEFPAGMVDQGEDALDTAKRELLEETGYNSKDIKLAGVVNPNPAFMTNITSTFIAKDLVKSDIQKLDEHEEIDFVLVPQEKFEEKVGGEEVNSAITIQAFYFYKKSTLSKHF